ncbi:hypothetical protein trd_0415 [Thermomicrobium roseum DSM 5159]|uniref:Uncharacterized protein n=1 Tax=Thermomicrobium roseum (strain ATCC 27502 / DSM 5159 / P-2) TaxID=309801 RepID=B9KY73_THERP|nr:hypothetical protein trd_0415 [Thermomicrobium roseum DSM 5159]
MQEMSERARALDRMTSAQQSRCSARAPRRVYPLKRCSLTS